MAIEADQEHRRPAPWNARPPNPVEGIFPGRNTEGVSKPPPNGAAAIKALFNAVKEMLSPKGEDAPQPVRRRRGETDKGFAAACRAMLRRTPKTGAVARGRFAGLRYAQEAIAPSDAYARARMYLSDTLDWLNLWQDNADNDHWHDGEFSATFEDYFPQP